MGPGQETNTNMEKSYLPVPTLSRSEITFKIRLLMSAAASGFSGHFEGTKVAPALDMSQPTSWSEDEKKAYAGY